MHRSEHIKLLWQKSIELKIFFRIFLDEFFLLTLTAILFTSGANLLLRFFVDHLVCHLTYFSFLGGLLLTYLLTYMYLLFIVDFTSSLVCITKYKITEPMQRNIHTNQRGDRGFLFHPRGSARNRAARIRADSAESPNRGPRTAESAEF